MPSAPTHLTSNSSNSALSLDLTVPAGGVAVSSTVLLAGIWANLSGSSATFSAADSQGNTYVVDSNLYLNASSLSTAILRGAVTTALLAGDTITITCSVNGVCAALADVSTDPLAPDQGTGTTGSSTAPSSGNAPTTTVAAELLYGVIGAKAAPTFTKETNWTVLTSVSKNNGLGTIVTIFPEYRVVSATGAYAATGTFSATAPWTAAIVTYTVAQQLFTRTASSTVAKVTSARTVLRAARTTSTTVSRTNTAATQLKALAGPGSTVSGTATAVGVHAFFIPAQSSVTPVTTAATLLTQLRAAASTAASQSHGAGRRLKAFAHPQSAVGGSAVSEPLLRFFGPASTTVRPVSSARTFASLSARVSSHVTQGMTATGFIAHFATAQTTVASSAGPTTIHYVTLQTAIQGLSTLTAAFNRVLGDVTITGGFHLAMACIAKVTHVFSATIAGGSSLTAAANEGYAGAGTESLHLDFSGAGGLILHGAAVESLHAGFSGAGNVILAGKGTLGQHLGFTGTGDVLTAGGDGSRKFEAFSAHWFFGMSGAGSVVVPETVTMSGDGSTARVTDRFANHVSDTWALVMGRQSSPGVDVLSPVDLLWSAGGTTPDLLHVYLTLSGPRIEITLPIAVDGSETMTTQDLSVSPNPVQMFAGDSLPVLRLNFKDLLPGMPAHDLTGATVSLKIRRQGARTNVFSDAGALAVIMDPSGIADYVLPQPLLAADTYEAQAEIVDSAGRALHSMIFDIVLNRSL